jgi:hypothetical protein
MRRFIERLGLTAGAYVSMIAVYMETMEQNFSRTVRAGHIKEAPQEHVVLADEAFRAELAALYGLPGISLLRGEFVLQHERGGVIAAKLRMQARVTQSCVVSLEPFEAKIDEQSALRFVPAKNLPEGESAELDAETLEGPDEIPYTGDMIDLSNWPWPWTLIRANQGRRCPMSFQPGWRPRFQFSRENGENSAIKRAWTL